MLLKRLELNGFKSFAQKTILEFSTPITAIVGPNGSGKSNIVEAMRFVLGEQSMKSLRGKRGEDLIFHGSKSQPRQNRASVTIVFDNRDRVFPIDYDEIEIKRVVYRDATNQYFINGSRTRLKDILELLASVHIGATSHHIISQGETDRILNASAKDRRAMIEDALGLKIYHYKLTESERRLSKTKENIAQTEVLRKEIALHLKFLEGQVLKIKQAEAMRTELSDLYKEFLLGESIFLRSEKERLEKEKQEPESGLKEIETKIIEKEHVLKEHKDTTNDSAEISVIEEKLKEIQKEKDALSRSLGRLEGLIEYAEERAKEDVTSEGGDIIFISQNALRIFSKNIEDITKEVKTDSGVEILQRVLKKIKENIFLFLKKYEQEEVRDETKRESLHKIVEEKEATEHALAELKTKEKGLEEAYHTLRRTSEEARVTQDNALKELFNLRSQKNEFSVQLKLFAYREERLRQDEARFHEECSDAGHLLGTRVLRFDDEEVLSSDVPSRDSQDKKKQKIERMKIKIEESGSGGSELLKEYEEVRERDNFLAKETSDLINTAESLEKLIKDLAERINKEFKEGITKINTEFQAIFSSMFGGGAASLSVVAAPVKKKKDTDFQLEDITSIENEEETEEGIEISVNLPTKRVKGLQTLSGGERSLTSIALVFAVTLVNPPPFLILDETDAALDEANSEKYGALLQKIKGRTQFIIITHNRETMTRAGVLYGITSAADGTSRVLSVKLDEAEEIAE